MHRSVSMMFAAVALVLGSGCSSETTNGGCESNDACDPGEVCTSGTCQKLCRDDTQCASGQVCFGSVCQEGTRSEPTIIAVDGDGADVCPDGEGTHCIRNGIILEGTNLDGVGVTITDEGGTDHSLTVRDGRTAFLLEADLPDVAPGSYTLTVANAAGSDQTSLTLLQGPPGEDFSPTSNEVVGLINAATDRINSARLYVGSGADDVAAGNHTHPHLAGDLTVGGTVNRAKVGEPTGIPLTTGGISTARGWFHTGTAMFPFEFAAKPAVLLTAIEPDDNGVTKCRHFGHGHGQVRWACWSHNTAMAPDGVSWLAIEPGVFSLPTQGGGTRILQAGIFDPSTQSDCTSCVITFPQTFTVSPIVFATVDESQDTNGPTAAKVVTATTTVATITTSHNNGDTTAYRIHWVAVEPTADDPILIGSRVLYADSVAIAGDPGTATFPGTLAKLPSAYALTVAGGNNTCARISNNNVGATGFDYRVYTDTTSGSSGGRLNWMVWIDD